MKSELVKGSLIILILSTFGNLLNYLFQVIMGRMLSVEEFGTLNALFSIFMITVTPSAVIGALVAKYVVEYNTGQNAQITRVFISRAIRISLYSSVIVFASGILLSPLIARYLNIASGALVVFAVLLISLNIPFAATIGIIQGLKHFSMLGLLAALLAATKLVLSIFCVWLGLKILGPLTATAIAISISLGFSLFYVKQKNGWGNQANLKLDGALYIKFFFSAFLLSVCMAFLMNMDMVMIKHYFPQSEAGIYSPAMVLSRIILYAPAALVQVMYPLTVEANVLNPRNIYKLIFKVLLANTAIIVPIIILLSLFSNFIITLLFGGRYIGASAYILPACLFVIPICYLTVLMNFAMAINSTKFLTATMAVGCILNLLLVEINHATILNVIWAMVATNSIIIMINLAHLGVEYRKFSLRILGYV